MELLPFSHTLIDNFKCPKCGTKNTARVVHLPKEEGTFEALDVSCRACTYSVLTKTKDAQ